MRRLWALLLAAVILSLAVLPVLAADIIFFTAVNNTLLELTEETLPVKYSSMIYVPTSVFNSNALGTYSLYSRSTQTVLISDGDRVLYFDMSAGNSYDSDGESYRYVAIYENDTAYVPAYFVATFFGFRYSYIHKDGKHIVRLTSGSVLSDADFFSAAESLMESRLKELEKQAEEPVPTPPPVVPPVPSAPPVQPTPFSPEVVDRSRVLVHLAILGLGEESERQLDALEELGLPVCFFATAEEVYENADLVRRIVGEGGSIGVRFGDDPAAEAAAFRTALRDTAMTASFLAATVDPDWEQAEAAAETGLSVWASRVEIATFDGCSRWLEASDWRCDLLLKPQFSELEKLAALLEKEHYTIEAITEMTKAQ